MLPTVGVIGASGAVGRAAAWLLLEGGTVRLRLGGRSRERLAPLAARAGADRAAAAGVDASDAHALAAFCRGCRIVVNCAGPSHRIGDTVARAALEAGADYVDPGGDDPLFESLSRLDLRACGRRAVISAGLLPGVSGLLPRWLAREGEEIQSVTLFTYLRDRFTPAAAGDYLRSLAGGFGEAGAVWRRGARVSRALEPLAGAVLPFFAQPMHAYPYLTTEIERAARAIGAGEASSYTVFENEQFVTRLGRIGREPAASGDLAAAALARATELELFGRSPMQQLVCRVEARAGEQPHTRVGLFRARDTYEVTAAMTAAAVVEVLAGEISPGVHYAALALEPQRTVARLGRCSTTAVLEPGEGAPAAQVEEGAL